MSDFYPGVESAVNCGGGDSGFFAVDLGARQGCIAAPSLFTSHMNWVKGKVAEQRYYRTCVGNIKITDIVLASDAVLFAKLLEVLMMALEVLH